MQRNRVHLGTLRPEQGEGFDCTIRPFDLLRANGISWQASVVSESQYRGRSTQLRRREPGEY